MRLFRPYRQQALYISSRASLATRRRSIRIVWLGCLAASSSIVARLRWRSRASAALARPFAIIKSVKMVFRSGLKLKFHRCIGQHRPSAIASSEDGLASYHRSHVSWVYERRLRARQAQRYGRPAEQPSSKGRKDVAQVICH